MKAPVPGNFSIKIVDDNPKNFQVLGKLLQEDKNENEFAINDETAHEWLNNKKFDMVLLDINMPDMNGFEVGTQDYVIKPYDRRELMVRVKTHLALKESREKLEEMNLSLEKKVKERILQLIETNNRLEEANLKLNELDKAKSEFLQMISHQIRTPLNVIAESK